MHLGTGHSLPCHTQCQESPAMQLGQAQAFEALTMEALLCASELAMPQLACSRTHRHILHLIYICAGSAQLGWGHHWFASVPSMKWMLIIHVRLPAAQGQCRLQDSHARCQTETPGIQDPFAGLTVPICGGLNTITTCLFVVRDRGRSRLHCPPACNPRSDTAHVYICTVWNGTDATNYA